MTIPPDHPRYRSLVARESLARYAREGIVSLEGLAAHGRGEAFDYLLGERTTESALLAEKTAAAFLLGAGNPVISVNGNTAALAAGEIRDLQEATGAKVEVNLFHRTEKRIRQVQSLLAQNGVTVLEGESKRLPALSHDRAFCLEEGIYSADVVLVPLEDGDRCEALRRMEKVVVTIDLNPLSRTARTATLTIVDELTRALPNVTGFCRTQTAEECLELKRSHDNSLLLRSALEEMGRRLGNAVD